MALVTRAALDAARSTARTEVHRRALRAGASAAEPTGLAELIWKGEVIDMIDDIQAIFEFTPDQKAALEPVILRSLTSLLGHYLPAANRATTAVAAARGRLPGGTLLKRLAGPVGSRLATRLGRHAGVAGLTAKAVARKAWLVPLAMGGATGALYEILGLRCINQCHAYLRRQIDAGPLAATR